MQSKIPLPVAIIVTVILVVVAGFVAWRSLARPATPTDEHGVALTPVEAKPGANALHGLWTKGVQPPKPKSGN